MEHKNKIISALIAVSEGADNYQCGDRKDILKAYSLLIKKGVPEVPAGIIASSYQGYVETESYLESDPNNRNGLPIRVVIHDTTKTLRNYRKLVKKGIPEIAAAIIVGSYRVDNEFNSLGRTLRAYRSIEKKLDELDKMV